MNRRRDFGSRDRRRLTVIAMTVMIITPPRETMTFETNTVVDVTIGMAGM